MPPDFTSFPVYIESESGAVTPLASRAVQAYDATNGAPLGDVWADEAGMVAGGALGVAAGTLMRFSVELEDLRCGYAEQLAGSGVGMALIIRASGGHNIVLRPQARPRWYPAATAAAARVELWRRDPDQPAAGSTLVGVFEPGGPDILIEYDPDTDRNVIFSTVSYSASGTPSVINLEDAYTVALLHRREKEPPKIGQNGAATADKVTIGITDFTRYARFRRVTVSANADMSDPLLTEVLTSAKYAERELPRYYELSRYTSAPLELAMESTGEALVMENSGGALPSTVYVTVAHSGGNGWTPESDVLSVTFAGGDGSGGSAGDFNPEPRDISPRIEVPEVPGEG